MAVHIRRPYNPVSSVIETPRQHQCDWETEHDEQHDDAHNPVRDVEHRKDLCDTLRQGPASDDVGNRNAVNLPPLQFSEEIFRIHWCSCESNTAAAWFISSDGFGDREW